MSGDGTTPVHAWIASVVADGGGDTPTVAAVMSRPLVTIPAGASLRHAREVMRDRHVHHLMLVDRGRIVAILSDRDVARGVSPWADGPAATRRDEGTLDRPVYACATFAMVTVQHDAPIEEAAALILEHGISALPVVGSDGGIEGIVTARDLLRELLACHLDR